MVIKNKVTSHVSPEIFQEPYNNIIKDIQKGNTSPEFLIEKFGINIVQSCLHAAESVNGGSKMADWILILRRAANKYRAGVSMEKAGKKLQQGNEVDLSEIKSSMLELQSDDIIGYKEIGSVVAKETPFTKTGWTVFDKELGGLPEIGLVVVGGSPGTGKTTMAIKLAKSFLREHKDKKVYFATLEMMAEEFKGRYNIISNDPATEADICTRFLINDKPMTLPEIIDEAATVDDLGMILVDFADLLVTDDVGETEMSTIYKRSMMAAKNLRCTFVLLSQFSRTYQGGIPRPFHLRYTGLAEALGWSIICLWNPAHDPYAERDEDKLPCTDGHAHIIIWKMRGGFRNHLDDNPGSLLVAWNGHDGWADTGIWISLKKEN